MTRRRRARQVPPSARQLGEIMLSAREAGALETLLSSGSREEYELRCRAALGPGVDSGVLRLYDEYWRDEYELFLAEHGGRSLP